MMVDRIRPVPSLNPEEKEPTSPLPSSSTSSGRTEISALSRIIDGFSSTQSGKEQVHLSKSFRGGAADARINNILHNLPLFQGTALRRNVEQAIASIVFAMKATIEKFKKEQNLRDIRKRRSHFGPQVEKSNQSKHS